MVRSLFSAFALVAVATIAFRFASAVAVAVSRVRDFVFVAFSPVRVAERFVAETRSTEGVSYESGRAKVRAFRLHFLRRHAFAGFEPGLSAV
jgi:hypothetical protein